MIEYNKNQLSLASKQYGFVRDTFEKVLRLKEILKFMNTDDYLREHLALKGGTAINMTIFNLPRLSVDIDADFIPNVDRDELKADREKVGRIIKEFMQDEGYELSQASRYSFSLDAFYFQYRNAGGNRDVLKIEINYSLREHIFSLTKRKILTDVFDDNFDVLTVAPIEIFAAKANALMSRAAARDLYDFNNMIDVGLIEETEQELLRKAVVFYHAISRESIDRTFDTAAIDALTFDKIRRDLFPVLRKKDHFDLESRKSSVKQYLHNLLCLTDKEKEFLTAFEGKEYMPELLFESADTLERLKTHPMALWKCRA